MHNVKKQIQMIALLLFGIVIIFSVVMHLIETGMDKEQETAKEKIRDDSIYAENENFNLLYYTVYTYDQFGNQSSCYEYSGDGSLCSYEELRYATNGDWLSKVSGNKYGDKKTQTDRHIYFSYVDGEERVTKVEYYNDGVLSSVTYNYFYDGKVAKLTAWISGNGEVKSYNGRIYLDTDEEETLARFSYAEDKTLTNFEYSKLDEANRLLEQYKGSGEDDTVFSEKTLVSYRDRDHTSRSVTYWPLNHLNSYRDDTYSADGKLLSSLEYLHGLNGGSMEDPMADMRVAEGHWAEYDGERLVWEMESSWEELIGFILYRYDEKGNVSLKFEYKGNDGSNRKLYRYVYDENNRVKELYTYSMGTEEFAFTDNQGIRYLLHFDSEYRTIKTITSYYPEGNIKEQYSFLKQDWVHENKMLWHDVYYYKSSLENKNKAYETTVYRYDIEGNLLEILDGDAL